MTPNRTLFALATLLYCVSILVEEEMQHATHNTAMNNTLGTCQTALLYVLRDDIGSQCNTAEYSGPAGSFGKPACVFTSAPDIVYN